jgi:Zn-dependent metalloprotease
MHKRLGIWLLPIGGVIFGLLLAAPLLRSSGGQAARRAPPPPGATVTWNEALGIPQWLDGPLAYTLSPDEQANPELAARNVLNHYRDLFGLRDANAEFQLIRVEKDRQLDQQHVRLQQLKDGIPVWTKVLLVHMKGEQVLGINGDYLPDLGLSTTPTLTAAEAEAKALVRAADEGTAPIIYAPTRLIIYVDEKEQATLAWEVKITVESPSWNAGYFVDAASGDVIHITPLTASDKYREIYDAQLRENLPGKLIAKEGTVPRDPAGAAVYKNAGLVYDYFKNTFGRDSYDDNGGGIYIAIHSPELGNSYWNGQMLVFGDMDNYITNKDDAYVLDIMGHEFTHAVVQYSADLVYESQSGALNESFADVFAVMIDRNDWHLFEDNTASPPVPVGWLRDMQDPSLGGNYNPRNPRGGFGQPKNMNEYANLPVSREGDHGGVHINSGIPNHVLYLAATAAGREATEQIWYRALSNYLTPRSDFRDFAQAIQKAAADLYGANSNEAKAIREALVRVNMLSGGGGAGVQPTPVPTTQGGGGPVNPTPAPVTGAGCSELVANGTFEAGKPSPWVEQTNLNSPIISADFAHTGKKSAWLGGTDKESFQYIYQDVALNANLKSITLTYWHYVEQNVEGNPPDADFTAVIADPKSGDVVVELESFKSSAATGQWEQSTLDLTGLAGKKIRLAFTANMVRGNFSNFFVDDVSIAGCTGAAPAPTTGGRTITVTGTITDSASGRPIEGAKFYVLKVSVAEASADGKLTNNEVLASGTSDRKGNFKLNSKLPRGQSYNVVILANGYKTLALDGGFEITGSDPDPLNLDVQLQRR